MSRTIHLVKQLVHGRLKTSTKVVPHVNNPLYSMPLTNLYMYQGLIIFTNANQFVNKGDDILMYIVGNEPDILFSIMKLYNYS